MARKHLTSLFLGSFLFSANVAFLSYINSSALSQFISEEKTGLVYIISALVAIFFLSYAPLFLRRLGNWKSAVVSLALSFLCLLGLGNFDSKISFILFFIGYFALNTMVFYLFDVFIEHYTENSKTGRTRGIYLALNNLAWISSPFIVGKILQEHSFNFLYLISASMVLPVIFIIWSKEKSFADKAYRKINFLAGWKILSKSKPLMTITFLNFLLQFFYATMVIYSPLYLSKTLGFSWETIGFIFSFMLLPFVLLQYPIGKIADKYFGEREFLIIGFLVMALSTAMFALWDGGPYIIMAILFLSRVGASATEVVSESYFFKHITDKQTTFISFFRDTAPIAYIVAPLLGTGMLIYGSYNSLFLSLTGFMLLGAGISLTIKDTK